MGPKTAAKKAAAAAARKKENAANMVIPKQLHEIPMRCINLERRKDRKENMRVLLEAFKISPKFLVAYDGLEVLMKGVVAEAVRQGQTEYLLQYLDQFTGEPKQSVVRVMGDANEKFPHKKWGVLACLLSHKKALEELQQSTNESEEYFLVFEDDCHMCNENKKLLMPDESKKEKIRNSYVKNITARFNEGFKWICNECPDWKLIYLGGVFGWAKKGEKEEQWRLTPKLLNGINTMQAHAYIIRRCAIDEVISHLNEGYATDGALCKYMSAHDGAGCYRFCPDLFAQPGQHAVRDSDILPPHIKPLAVSAAPEGPEAIARIVAALDVQSQQVDSSVATSSSGLASSGKAAEKKKVKAKKATKAKIKTKRSPSPLKPVESVAKQLKVINLADSDEENNGAASSSKVAEVAKPIEVKLRVPAEKDEKGDPTPSPPASPPPIAAPPASEAPRVPASPPASAPPVAALPASEAPHVPASPPAPEAPRAPASPLAPAARAATPPVYRSQSQTDNNRVDANSLFQEPTNNASHLSRLRAERQSVLSRGVVRSRSPKLAQKRSLGSVKPSLSPSPSRVEAGLPTSTTETSILPGVEVGASSSSCSVPLSSINRRNDSQPRIQVPPKRGIPVPPKRGIPVPPRRDVPPKRGIPVPPRRNIPPRSDIPVQPRRDTAVQPMRDIPVPPAPQKAPPAMPKSRVARSAQAAAGHDDRTGRHVDAQSSDPLGRKAMPTVSKATAPSTTPGRTSPSCDSVPVIPKSRPPYKFHYPPVERPCGRTAVAGVSGQVEVQPLKYRIQPNLRSIARPHFGTPSGTRGANSGGYNLRAVPYPVPKSYNSQGADMHRPYGKGEHARPWQNRPLQQCPRGHSGQRY